MKIIKLPTDALRTELLKRMLAEQKELEEILKKNSKPKKIDRL